MKLELKKELPIIGMVLVPLVYLAIIWDSLPEKVPTHWNYKGEIDDWGTKFSLVILLFMFPVLTYMLMLIIPKIDPKKRIYLMGGKFYQLKFSLVLFVSLLSLFILYLIKKQSVFNQDLIYIPIGILLMVLGNYFKVIQPNYFIGIRTPWTLESHEIWKSTHLFAGRLWFIGGFAIVLGSLIFSGLTFSVAFIFLILGFAVGPVIYSYFKFKNL